MSEAEGVRGRIDVFAERLAELRMRWPDAPRVRPYPPEPFDVAMEELNTSLEELRAQESELLERTEELSRLYASLSGKETYFQDLFVEAPDPYLATDWTGNVREANRAAAALLHRPSHYLVGKPFRVFVAPATRNSYDEFVRRIDRFIGHTCQFELQIIEPDEGGRRCEVSVTVSRGRGVDPPLARWILRPCDGLSSSSPRCDPGELPQ